MKKLWSTPEMTCLYVEETTGAGTKRPMDSLTTVDDDDTEPTFAS